MKPTMPRARWSSCLLVTLVGCVLSVAGRAPGEIVGIDSVEWMSADSDLVVRGRIVEFAEDGKDDWNRWFKAVIRVEETIKQEAGPAAVGPGDSVTVRFYGAGEQGVARDGAGGGPRVYFLVAAAERDRQDGHGGYGKYSYAFRTGRAWLALNGRAPASGHEGLAVAMNFRTLSGDETLHFLRAAAQAETPVTRRRRQYTHLDVPFGEQTHSRLFGGSAVWLMVPVDERLERIARAWAEDPDRRRDAVRCLATFKSEQNARVLQSLLGDLDLDSSGRGKAWRGYYVVRSKAYRVLRGWGVDVARPPIYAPDDFRRPARAGVWGAGLFLLAASCAGWLWGGRRGRSAARRGLAARGGAAAAAVCLALAAGSAWLWARQFSAADEITFPTAAGRHWLSAYRGSLQFVTIEGWPAAPPDRPHSAPDVPAPLPESPGVTYAAFPLGPGPAPVEPLWQGLGAVSVARGRFGFVYEAGTATDEENKPHPYRRYSAPLWAVFLIAVAPPGWRGARAASAAVVRRRRRRGGRCEGCGYDLRGTLGRCPECGRDR